MSAVYDQDLVDRLAIVVRRTRAGATAASIAEDLGVSVRTVSRYRGVLISWGHIADGSCPRRPWQTKPCMECGKQYGPRFRRSRGCLNWTTWERSTFCGNRCRRVDAARTMNAVLRSRYRKVS